MIGLTSLAASFIGGGHYFPCAGRRWNICDHQWVENNIGKSFLAPGIEAEFTMLYTITKAVLGKRMT